MEVSSITIYFVHYGILIKAFDKECLRKPVGMNFCSILFEKNGSKMFYKLVLRAVLKLQFYSNTSYDSIVCVLSEFVIFTSIELVFLEIIVDEKLFSEKLSKN